jgi:hypothetical protein
MRAFCVKNGLAVGVILLFIGVAVQPSIGLSNNDDTTPPVTTHKLDPPKPDGKNGWYVNNVNVTLIAIDDISGVNTTYYRIHSREWETYDSPFVLSEDGDDILIEYYSVDKAGNIEEVKSSTLDIDQTEPDMELYWEFLGGDPLSGWEYLIRAIATDDTSGMNRVMFRLDNAHKTVYGSGPVFEWYTKEKIFFRVFGMIKELNVTEDHVQFLAVFVIVGNLWKLISFFDVYAYDNASNCNYSGSYYYNDYPYETGIYRFRYFKLSNYYRGFIGNRFIFARFYI